MTFKPIADGDVATPEFMNARFEELQGVEAINVKTPTYGAVGDGITDDTDAIQAAADAASGRTLYFPKGTYMIRGSAPSGRANRLGIRPASNTTWLFDKGAALKLMPQRDDTYAVINIEDVSDVTLIGPRVDGSKGDIAKPGQQGHGIWVAGSHRPVERIRIFDAYVVDCHGAGLAIGASSFVNRDIYVAGSTFDRNRREGVFITQGEDITLVGCVATNTGGHSTQSGFRIEPLPYPDADDTRLLNLKRIRLIGCTARGNAGRNFGIGGLSDIPEPVTVTLQGCSSEGAGAEGYIIESVAGGRGTGTGCIILDSCVSVNDALSGVYVRNICIPILISNMYIESCNSARSSAPHYGSAFTVRATADFTDSGGLSVVNSHVNNASGNILHAVSTVPTGDGSRILDVDVEVAVSGSLAPRLVYRGGEHERYAGTYRVCDLGHRVSTLDDGPVPSVGGVRVARTGGSSRIAGFGGGHVGQEIQILAEHATTIEHGLSVLLNGGVNYAMVPGDTLTLRMFRPGQWHEVARSANG